MYKDIDLTEEAVFSKKRGYGNKTSVYFSSKEQKNKYNKEELEFRMDNFHCFCARCGSRLGAIDVGVCRSCEERHSSPFYSRDR